MGDGVAAMRALILIAALGCATAPRSAARAADPRLAAMLSELIRFPTVAGNDQARKDEQAWLLRTAASLGLVARDAGPVTEIELPGPAGAPVLGLVVHGDVQPVDAAQWTVPPFDGLVRRRRQRSAGAGAARDAGSAQRNADAHGEAAGGQRRRERLERHEDLAGLACAARVQPGARQRIPRGRRRESVGRAGGLSRFGRVPGNRGDRRGPRAQHRAGSRAPHLARRRDRTGRQAAREDARPGNPSRAAAARRIARRDRSRTRRRAGSAGRASRLRAR